MDADLENASTLSSVAVLIAETLRSYDCDPEPLFAEAGIDIGQIADPNVRFQTKKMQHLWGLVVEASGDPCFGLTAAQQFQPAALQGLGFAWLASDTLRDALGRLAHYSRLINPVVDISLEDTDTTVNLVLTGPEKWPNYIHAASDLGMAAFLQMCRFTAGANINPARVTLQRPEPPCMDRFYRLFAAPIEFNAPANKLCFDRAIAEATLNTANPELARINDRMVVDYLARYDRHSITMRVRARIIEQLPDGKPNQEHIANALNISLRSLQRKLKDEETTFKTLLEGTRRELAVQYIRDSQRPICEVTYLLGFSEPSNFTRAFKRWTGKSPGEFRTNA